MSFCAVQAVIRLNILVSVQDKNDSIIICTKSNEQHDMSSTISYEVQLPSFLIEFKLFLKTSTSRLYQI